MEIQKLKINKRFESCISPMTEDEFSQLRENIMKQGGVLNPIIIWNEYIVDGHNRYKILEEQPNLPFTTHEIFFETEEDAISWICSN